LDDGKDIQPVVPLEQVEEENEGEPMSRGLRGKRPLKQRRRAVTRVIMCCLDVRTESCCLDDDRDKPCAGKMRAGVYSALVGDQHSVVQVDSATVESGNRYSVTELAQHQQRTTVMPTPYVTSLFLHCGPSRTGLWLVSG